MLLFIYLTESDPYSTRWLNHLSQRTLPISSSSDGSRIEAVGVRRGSGACKGDSGGPLVCQQSSEEWRLVGIASRVQPYRWSSRLCGTGAYDLYMRVAHFADFFTGNGYSIPLENGVFNLFGCIIRT